MKLFLKMGLLAVVLLTLESCSNTEVVKPTKSNLQNINQQLKSSVLDAQTSNNIPSKFYKVAQKYSDKYQHLQQTQDNCSWTSYVMTVGAIAKVKGLDYDVTQDKVQDVKSYCQGIERCMANEKYCGSSPGAMNSYAIRKDSDKVISDLQSEGCNDGGRFMMVKRMLNHIEAKRTPFIVLGSTLTKRGKRIGHYYIIWAIYWKRGGTGSYIFYTNPMDDKKNSFNDQLKVESLTSFLDNMCINNPNALYYNALFFR